MNKIQLNSNFGPGNIVAVVIDDKVFESTVKFRSVDPQTGQAKYSLHGLKGMFFSEADFLTKEISLERNYWNTYFLP